jgi:hypothetical protein
VDTSSEHQLNGENIIRIKVIGQLPESIIEDKNETAQLIP